MRAGCDWTADLAMEGGDLGSAYVPGNSAENEVEGAKSLDVADLAAWTLVGRALFNLDETINKE